MKFVSRLFRCIFACALVLSLMPTFSFAKEAGEDRATNADDFIDSVEQFSTDDENAEEIAKDTDEEAEDMLQKVPDDGIQLFSGIQDDVAILEQGDFGEDNALHWAYRNDASLTISGVGTMPDYTEKGGQPWNKFLRTVERVIVDEGVTSIGAYSFQDCDYLHSIELPDSLSFIGDCAFYDCDGIEEISLPDMLSALGNEVFKSCDKLKTCHLSDALEVLSAGTFDHCKKLERVDMPRSLKSINYHVFDFCVALKDLSLPEGLLTIKEEAFGYCRIAGDVTFPSSLKTVGFYSQIKIDGTVSIAENTPQDCVNRIMSNIRSCGYVSYPADLKFAPRAEEVLYGYQVAEGNENNLSIDGILFSKAVDGVLKYDDAQAVLVGMPTRISGEYTVPEGTREIGQSCLSSSITTVNIPASVEVISDRFSEPGLEAINVAKSNSRYCSIEGILYNKTATELIRCPEAYAFDGPCIIPDTVTSITGSGFYHCEKLTSVVIPRSMTSFSGDFSWCPNLTAIYFPKEVTSIKDDCFKAPPVPSRNGFNVFYEGSESEWNKIALSNGTSTPSIRTASIYFDVSECGVCSDGLLYYVDHGGTLNVIPDEKAKTALTRMRDYGDDDAPWKQYAEQISSVEVSSKIKNIGAHAFNGLTKLQKLTLSFAIESVGAGAFFECDSLVDVECMGGCFEVQPAASIMPSFDASKVTLHIPASDTEWKENAAYDVEAGTWNGYRLVSDIESVLPELSSVAFRWNDDEDVKTIEVEGVKRYSDNGYKTVAVMASSEAGDDITRSVDVAIESPKRVRPVSYGVPFGNNGYHDDHTELDVVYNPLTCSIEVGNCAVAGEYKITITPKKHAVDGTPIIKTLTVTRAPEKLYDAVGWYSKNNILIGHYAESLTIGIYVSIWNQYCEEVSSSCAISSVWDSLTDTNVTAEMGERGILGFTGTEVSVSQFANPRDYVISFYDPSGKLSSRASATIRLYRVPELLNQPYAVSLVGGPDEMTINAGESWSSRPYRVKVLDCYDDPCWPELRWSIKDCSNKDATSHFEIDNQGYLMVKPSVVERLEQGCEKFDVTALADGCDYNGSVTTVHERESNSLTFSMKLQPSDSEPITHTATFKVGDETIGTVVFEEGDTSLVEPVLPPKENYIGEWEPYDLASQTSDLVVQGVYSPMDPNKVSDVDSSTDAKYENGLVTINLTASSATKNIKIESSSTKPLDVVMVLDRSGSMNDDGKLTKLKQCAIEFAQKLYENAAKTGADHRIALAGFAYGAVSVDGYNKSGYENSGLLVTENGGERSYRSVCSRGCADALLSINKDGGINKKIVEAIDSLTAGGATAADVGLDIARMVFADNPAKTDNNGTARERIVLFITDGVPTSMYSTNCEQVRTTAANAIAKANTIKNGQGARIYSVGVDSAASASASFNSTADGVITKGSGNKQTVGSFDFNRFLHAVSSNFSSATGMANLGIGDKGAGYYMAANDTASLDSVFTTILYSSVYKTQAFDRATLSYLLPAGLVLTMKNEEEMRASLATQGIDPECIEVIRKDDSTRIVFHDVSVNHEIVDGVSQYVARVSFQVSVDKDVSGSIQVGQGASIEVGGQYSCLEAPAVQIPSDRRLVVFKINGEIYEIRDVEAGDTITVPDTDIARWLELEKQQNPTVKESDTYVVFETSTLNRSYTMKWIINGISTTETHSFGDTLSIPSAIKEAVPEGMEISHWSPALPQTMPARNVTCSAVLTPIHTHAYTALSYQTGRCDEGIVVHDVCACGEEREEKQEPQAHAYEAILSSAGQYQTTVEKLVCHHCGNAVNKNITYKVSKSSLWGNLTVLELDKVENEVIQSGYSDDDISIRFYVGTEKNGTYKVYRMEESGVQQTYYATVVDGYLTFEPDHFSIYVVDGPIAEGDEHLVEPTFDQVKDVIENAELPAASIEDAEFDEDKSDLGNDGNTDSDDKHDDSVNNQGSNGSIGEFGSGANEEIGTGGYSSFGNESQAGEKSASYDAVQTGDIQGNDTSGKYVINEDASFSLGGKIVIWFISACSLAALIYIVIRFAYIRRRKN